MRGFQNKCKLGYVYTTLPLGTVFVVDMTDL